MDPQRPRSAYPHHPHPPPHHVATSANYVYNVHQNGNVEGGVPVPVMEGSYLNMSGAIPDYSIPRGDHAMFLQPQLHQLPPSNLQSPPRSIDHNQLRLHYHQQYDSNLQPPPLQVEQLSDQAELSTEDFIYQGNTESMINDSVNEEFLATGTSAMSLNDPNLHAHLQHGQSVNYSSSSERNIYDFPLIQNQCMTSIPPPPAAEGVLDLSKGDDDDLTQFKEEQEVSQSPLPHHESQYHRPDDPLSMPFDLSQGQQASVIVHTANISPGSRSLIPEPNSEDCGPFRILTTSSASPAKGNLNLQQQQMELQHQYSNIMSEIPAEQKPLTNHLTEPVLNYNTSPVTSSPHQHMWNGGGYTTQNQLISPPKSHPRLHSSNASQSLSAIVNMNNQLSQRHFSENSPVGSGQLMHILTQNKVPQDNHYNVGATTTTTTPSNFSPETQLQMMHEDTSYVHPATNTPGPSPKKTKSPRNNGDKMGRGRGRGTKTPGSPDVTAPFQNVQNHYNHQLTSPYPEMAGSVDGKTPKKGRGRGKKVVANALNISCAESNFEAVPAEANNVDLNKSLHVFTPEEIQRQVENGLVVIKPKRPYVRRAPKSLNNSVTSDSSPEKPVRKISAPKVNRKNKSDQVELEPVQSQVECLPKFETISRGVPNIEDNLSSSSPPLPSQVISLSITGRGRGRGRGVRRSTGEGRGRGVRRSIGEGRGRGGRRSTGEGRGRGLQPAPRINDEITGSHMSNLVAIVTPHQVPWVGPPPGSSDFPVNGVLPGNHMGLHTVIQLKEHNSKAHRVITVDGKPMPLENGEKSISKALQVPNPGVIASNQIISASIQAQMAETAAGIVPRRASPAKGQRKSFRPRPKPKVKVNLEFYQGSDDEIDSNADDDDDDDEDYEDLEKRQRITRRNTRRARPQRIIVDEDIEELDIEPAETLLAPQEESGLANEMPVSLQDIKKEKGEDEPMQQQQQEAENVGEPGNSLQQRQSNVLSEDAEMIQDVKQEKVEEEVMGAAGTSEMQVDTEGTFGDAESGLVAETSVDVKPVVAKLKVKNRRLLPSMQRQLKRPIKKPRIPMRESLGAQFTSRRVEKRGRKKKTVDRDNIVVKTEQFESKPREMAEKTEKQLVIPNYTEGERKLIYDNKRFVIDISSVDKPPDQIYIWQIIKSENCLRQYYPSKYGEKQFFISSPVKWYFFEEEFKSDEFYARFLPIVVVVANKTEQEIERRGVVSASQESTVQYVYQDRQFFNRVLKCIGKIDTMEFLRPHFMNALNVFTLIAIQPTLLRDRDIRHPSYGNTTVEFAKSWYFFAAFVLDLWGKVVKKFPFPAEVLDNLMHYPTLTLSGKDANKTEPCSGCHHAVPCNAVKFPTTGHMGNPYHLETLIESTPENFPQPPKPMSFCRACSSAAKRLHRLIHFRFHTLKLIKQNIAKDVASFHKLKTQMSEQILLWLQTKDVNWRNVIFLDFQVVAAEVQAEYTSRPTVAVDASTPTPIANPDLDAAAVPNEMNAVNEM